MVTTYADILKVAQEVEKDMKLKKDEKPQTKWDRNVGASSSQDPPKRYHQAKMLTPQPPKQTQTATIYAYCHHPGHHFDECRKRLVIWIVCPSDEGLPAGC
ncbi:uncharacterized protein M6B38_329145 [Iris pallida]|uniref:Uncharacterized protein n=1 Tax=Iris pallida TaxID=29817 RepID=A0AAX6H551_IRIPA|nr:uncharacterized protein M6B38_329145 [Iris pallida]